MKQKRADNFDITTFGETILVGATAIYMACPMDLLAPPNIKYNNN